MSYYWDWEILHCEEEIFDCTSSGVPHRHVVDRIIARRHRNDKDVQS
jgi:tellurite methyltransferase